MTLLFNPFRQKSPLRIDAVLIPKDETIAANISPFQGY
ncbi:hypothetical protein Cabys_522 [Caldithrix abyssi DSM 13497]|uniref:Uncharacterized protein n=1 Tax=Caldithrix abyssi DSM 13497 TaxID=880073 RepID=A0A1J1C4R0_CALAY|nr:hypothetical protein Cabys_522 [Caldithrix abyssi DSM 13497]